jgi:MFS family permease
VIAGARGTFAAFTYPQFRLLWAGQLSARFGDLIQQFALGWLLVELADRDGTPQLAPLYVGLLGLGRGVPATVVGLLAGAVADRMDRRRLLVIARLLGVAAAAAIAALVLSDRAAVAPVVALTIVSGIGEALDVPTRQASVPRLVPARDLVSAQGLMNSTASTAVIVGPLIGGALIIPIGIGGLIVVDGAFYAIAVIALLGLHAMPPTAVARQVNVFRAVGEGITFIARDRILRWVFILSIVVALTVRPLTLLLPAVVKTAYGAGAHELSLLLSVAGVGAIIGTVFAASLGGIQRRGLVLLWSVVCWGIFVALFSLQQTASSAMFFVWLPSLTHFSFAGLALVFCQTRAPDEIRARVISIYVMIASSGASLGALVMGTLGSAIGVTTALTLGGVVAASLAVVALIAVPELRDARASAPPGPVLAPAPTSTGSETPG